MFAAIDENGIELPGTATNAAPTELTCPFLFRFYKHIAPNGAGPLLVNTPEFSRFADRTI